jgi:lysophospholipase
MRFSICVLLAVAVSCSAADAISEGSFAEAYREKVWPHYESGEFGSFEGQAGVRIAYAKYEVGSEQGALVILPGKSESFLKYAELIYDLRGSGYSLYLMDHRGMGFSEALLSDDPGKVYVESFDHYVQDLRTFIDQVVDTRPHARHVILGHSMGGTVALLFLERYPEVFDGAILSAPLLQIVTDPLPEPVAQAMSEFAVLIGLGRRYCPWRGPWEPGTFAGNTATRSHARWSLWEEQLIPAQRLAGMGGATQRWLRESMEAGRRAQRGAGQIRVPVILFQAGLDDFVKPGGQEHACRRMPDCELRLFPTARHEILMESDEIRNEAVGRILDFLARTVMMQITHPNDFNHGARLWRAKPRRSGLRAVLREDSTAASCGPDQACRAGCRVTEATNEADPRPLVRRRRVG